MNCEEARILIGGDPENPSAELLEHLQTCAECQTYRQQILAVNSKLRRALELNWRKVERAAPRPGATAAPTAAGPTATPTSAGPAVPPAAAGPVPTSAIDQSNVTVLRPRERAPVPKQKRPRLVALAASVAAASVGALVLWLSRPPESLAAEIVKHVEGEPNSWSRTEPVTVERLRAVLRKSSVRLGPGMESIVYASSCWFRGHFVPHLVVMTPDGPVTAMILVNEKISAPQQFKEDGFSGLLVPAPPGSVAVLSRTAMPLDPAASAVVRALQAAAQGDTSTALPSSL